MNGNNATANAPDVITHNGHLSSLLGTTATTGGTGSGGLLASGGGLGTSTATTNGVSASGGGLADSDLSRMVLTNGSTTTGSGGGPGSISGCSTPNTVVDQRMSATGFEETELSYSVSGEDCSPLNDKVSVVIFFVIILFLYPLYLFIFYS